jgi:hypothetical protein
MAIDPATLAALAAFPDQLAAHYAAIPIGFHAWNPPTWAGIPSEHFNALEQLCHVRDIEVEGYHVRLRRTLEESHPLLASIDSEAIAIERDYVAQDADAALAAFRDARVRTLALVATITPEQFQRTAEFEGYGAVTLQGLLHYLCSHDQQHLAGLQWLRGQIESARSVGADRAHG